VRPAFFSACVIALDGWVCSELSGPATLPCAPISASHGQAQLLGLRLRHHDDRARAVGDRRRRRGGDRAVLRERRAQLGQRLGRRLRRICSSSVTTIGSPRRCGISTGTISSAKCPFFWAAAARWWLRAPNSSCASRWMP
jgi:hypothetical protein